MTLPFPPSQYNKRDQDEIRRILEHGLDDIVARLYELESAPVVVPPGSSGRPFGMFDLWSSDTARRAGSTQFNSAFEGVSPTSIIPLLNSAAANGTKLIITMAGGGHANYLTNSAGGTCPNNGFIDVPTCAFDRAKWNAKIQTFNTPAIKAAIASHLPSGLGTILYSSTIDEPNHRSWGPSGTFTKPIIDDMAQYIKNIFPGIPTLCPIRPDWRLSDPKYQILDAVQAQYVNSFGSITTWRNEGWANLIPDKVQLNFSLNFGNGGAGFGETVCPPVGQPAPVAGGTGASSGRCEMGYGSTSSQVEVYAASLLSPDPVTGREPVGLLGWDQVPHIDTWLSRSLVQSSMARIRALADSKTSPMNLYRLP
jgi:hypothetical protein